MVATVVREACPKARRRGAAVVAASALLALVTASVCEPIQAGQWRIKPRVSVRETYSDNISRASTGRQRHEFVTSISPGISARGRGGRLDVGLAYDLDSVRHARGINADRLNHRLQANARAELIKQLLSVSVAATAGQQNVDNTASLANDTVSANDSTSQFFTYSVSPMARHRLGSYADVTVTTRLSQVFNEQALSSSSRTTNATVSSGSRFQRLGWRLNVNSRFIENSTGSTSEFRNGSGRLSYRFNRKASVFASVGLQLNDFRTLRADADGATWQIGGTWIPTSRTSLQGSYNRQFFGNHFAGSLRHRSRRAVFAANYSESVTTTSIQQLEQVLVPFVDPFGEPVLDPGSGEPILVPVDTATLTDEVMVLRRFEGSVTWQGRRTSASLRSSAQLRNFEVSADEESVFGMSASLSRRLSRRLGVVSTPSGRLPLSGAHRDRTPASAWAVR